MNLKLVAVSMSVLGLISSPVFADTMHKHKHHKKHHHHHHHMARHDYKASGAMPVQAAPVAETSATQCARNMDFPTQTIFEDRLRAFATK